ncbi:MAG: ABC transporter ATP-binding protein [Xanthomonadales bacterium]|nr:ABC transporter ATP-binding protein [Xanthomonadales bacterium]
MTNNLLSLSGVGKIYQRAGQEVVALHDFSMSVDAGEIVGLLGPNGSGKTTFVKLVTGISAADQGTLTWRGKPIGRMRLNDNLRQIGVLLEGRGACYERLSTLENARYFCRLREAQFDRRYFDELAELLEVTDVKAPVRQLSTGNKLRAAMLGCLIHRPALALLDEPTLGLDLFGIESLERLLRHGARHGTTFVVSSHDIHFIERLCQRIVCIREGRKVFDGQKTQLLNVSHQYLLSINTGSPSALDRLNDAIRSLALDSAWQMSSDLSGQLPLRDHQQACEVLAALQPCLKEFQGIELRKISLHEKYRRLIGEDKAESGKIG